MKARGRNEFTMFRVSDLELMRARRGKAEPTADQVSAAVAAFKARGGVIQRLAPLRPLVISASFTAEGDALQAALGALALEPAPRLRADTQSALKKRALSALQQDILASLRSDGPQRTAQLADRLDASRKISTGSITGLVLRGLIKRDRYDAPWFTVEEK